MCAIVDVNCANEVFGGGSPAAKGFLRWIVSGKGHLVFGGKLRGELDRSREFREWLDGSVKRGTGIRGSDLFRRYCDTKVDNRERELQKCDLKSNDHHIIALADVSGARLLYSRDKDLQSDFKNKNLLDPPRGRVYNSQEGKEEFDKKKRQLLRNACSSCK